MPVDIVIPSALPRPLADGHRYRPVDPALTVPKDQGELRRLPRYTAVPRQLALVWRFTQAEFDTFWDWYEDDLDAGARRFDVFVGRQGGGAIDGTAPGTWHTAQFVQPPQHEPLAGGRWRVQAQLLCIGDPFDVRIAPGILASGSNSRTGGARFVAPAIFASGENSRGGSAYTRPQLDFLPGGENSRGGGWFTNLAPGSEDALLLVWMQLTFGSASVDEDDAALALTFMRVDQP